MRRVNMIMTLPLLLAACQGTNSVVRALATVYRRADASRARHLLETHRARWERASVRNLDLRL